MRHNVTLYYHFSLIEPMHRMILVVAARNDQNLWANCITSSKNNIINNTVLTHSGQDEMDNISQMTF